MPEDELPRTDSESAGAAFELDDEAISTLLDNFVETQTGPSPQRVSRPPNPDDPGALAAQRSVFQDVSRHQSLPLVGDSAETQERRIAFSDYRVDDQMMDTAGKDAIFMHCLPALRGEEVTDAVIEGKRSAVFDQAENRLHAQKALLLMLLAR